MESRRSLLFATLILSAFPFWVRAADLPVPVRTTQARAGENQERVSLTGTVVATRRALVASELAGIVAEFSVRAGDHVKAGATLARLRHKPLELRLGSARGELAEAEAALRSSQLRLDRLRELSDSEVVSRQTVDDALYETQAAQARVTRLEVEVERSLDDLERATIRAPFAGAVVAEHTQRGQWLEPGDAVLELVSLENLEVQIDIPERYFSLVHSGSRVHLGSGESGGPPVVTEVRAIVPSASVNARTFPAFIRLPVNFDSLGIGATAPVALDLGLAQRAVWVPRDAVVQRGSRSVVFKVGEDSTAKAIEVKVTGARGEWQAVLGNVAAGDSVVIEGNEGLGSGALVLAERREYSWP